MFLNVEGFYITFIASFVASSVIYGLLYERRREYRILAVLGSSPTSLQFMVLGEVFYYWALSLLISLFVSSFLVALNIIWTLEASLIVLLFTAVPVLMLVRKVLIKSTVSTEIKFKLREEAIKRWPEKTYTLEIPILFDKRFVRKVFPVFLKKFKELSPTYQIEVEELTEDKLVVKVDDEYYRASVTVILEFYMIGEKYSVKAWIRWPRIYLDKTTLEKLTHQVADNVRKAFFEIKLETAS